MEKEALLGRTIAGKYAIEALVGEGAMGAVYRATQTTLGTTVAVKVLHRWLAGEPMFAARFLREAQAASRVDHPSSMRVIDFGEEPDGLLYIAMEFLDGRTLAKVLEEEGPFSVARIVDIASQALAALQAAHEIGVIHRDIKPENIMILSGTDDEGRTHDVVKVCDFGVAKLLDPAGRGRGPSVTANGIVVGTPEYMSPEQARGDILDARSDVYSMGVLLFQLMTGKVPFDSSTAFGTALMHVTDEPTRPRLLNPRVDTRLEAVCLKAMRKRPEERHASARELRAELRALAGVDGDATGDLPPSSRLTDQIERSKPRSGLVVAAAVLAASVAAGAYLIRREPQATHVQSASFVATQPLDSAPAAPTTTSPTSPVAVAPPPSTEPKSEAPTPAARPEPTAKPTSRPHAAAAKARRAPASKARVSADPTPPPPAAGAPAQPTPPAPKKADPADEPLPVFPVPGPDPLPAPAAPPAAAPAPPAASPSGTGGAPTALP